MEKTLTKAHLALLIIAAAVPTFIFLEFKAFLLVQTLFGLLYFLFYCLSTKSINLSHFTYKEANRFYRFVIIIVVLIFLSISLMSLVHFEEQGLNQEELYEYLNKYEINPTGTQFVDLSSNFTSENLTKEAAASYGVKVIMEIENKTPQEIKIKKTPKKIQYTG